MTDKDSHHPIPTEDDFTNFNAPSNISSANNALQNVTRSTSKKASSKKRRKHKYSASRPTVVNNLSPAYDPLWKPVAIIANRYAMGPKIGSGSFGSVHAGVDLSDNYRYIAIKLEPMNPSHHPQLEREYKIYSDIHAFAKPNSPKTKAATNKIQSSYRHEPATLIDVNDIGIPKILYFGPVHKHPYNSMIMEMCGPSLERLFNICHRKFSLKTVLMIADQMLSRLEYIHDAGYLHRDLKPDNFLMGMYNCERVVYAVDFGLGKSYIVRGTGKHIPYCEGKTLTGTARYASVNTHLGLEQSRRDDLESLGYIFMYFLRGKLPWQGIKAKTRQEKYEKIARKKLSTLPEQLCRGYPEEFAHLIRYSWRLGYEERPNYERLRRNFREVFFKLGYTADWIYDWDKKGVGATQLALENHPFIRGNVDGDRVKKKRQRRQNRDRQQNNEQQYDDDYKQSAAGSQHLPLSYANNWGGDKHLEHSRKSKQRKLKTNDNGNNNNNNNNMNVIGQKDAMKPMISPILSRPRHSLPILSKTQTQSTKDNEVINAHQQQSQVQNVSCLSGISRLNMNEIENNNNNVQKQTPIKRQRQKHKLFDFSCFQSQKSQNNERQNTEKLLPNRRQSAILKTERNNASKQQKNERKRSQPLQHQRKALKYQYYTQQSQAYSPSYHTTYYNNNNTNTYTPTSYSHYSSTPSPINPHINGPGRRYSDLYSAKPIISSYTQQPIMHSLSPHSHSNHGNSGYLINAPSHSTRPHITQNSDSSPLKLQRSQSHNTNIRRSAHEMTSAQLHDEWVKQYRLQQQQQQQQQHHHYQRPRFGVHSHHSHHSQHQQQPMHTSSYQYNPSYHHSHSHSQHRQRQRQQNIGLNNNNNDFVSNTNSKFVSVGLNDSDRRNLIPLNRENKSKSSLPLNIGLIKKNNKINVAVEVSSKSNSGNKSHRSSKTQSHRSSNSDKRSCSNPNSHKSSNTNTKCHSHGVDMNKASISWKRSDMEEEDDGFEILETQWTGRSITTQTQTKDEKERHNSGSTSKGLSQLTERDYPSMTDTLNANRRQTTPRSYTIDNHLFKHPHSQTDTQHPFIKNCSAHSNQSITQQTVSSDLFHTNNKSKNNETSLPLAVMKEDVKQNDDV